MRNAADTAKRPGAEAPGSLACGSEGEVALVAGVAPAVRLVVGELDEVQPRGLLAKLARGELDLAALVHVRGVGVLDLLRALLLHGEVDLADGDRVGALGVDAHSDDALADVLLALALLDDADAHAHRVRGGAAVVRAVGRRGGNRRGGEGDEARGHEERGQQTDDQLLHWYSQGLEPGRRGCLAVSKHRSSGDAVSPNERRSGPS